MTLSLINFAYLVASILFIFGLKMKRLIHNYAILNIRVQMKCEYDKRKSCDPA